MDDREAAWAAAMRAALAGDRWAYERLLREVAQVLRGRLRWQASGAGPGAGDVEDVVQEVLLGIHAKRHTWDTGRPILPWIHAIARHKAADAARRRARHRRDHVEAPVDDFADLIPAPAPDPDAGLVDVERHLSPLPEGQRSVVRALLVEGGTVRGVAARLAMSEGAVRVALHRGLARLAARAGLAPQKDEGR